MTDYLTFVNNATVLLADELPLQSLDSAFDLVIAYISDIGGWIPDDPLDPYGNGDPANSFTEQQVADAITTNEFDAVYDVNFHVTVELNLQICSKFTKSLTLDAVAASMAGKVTSFITDHITQSDMPIAVDTVTTQTSISDRSDLGGYTTQAIRQTIATDLSGVDKLVDFKVLTLQYARTTYGLDDTWNVMAFYTEENQPITVIIKKYTNDAYATLDGVSTRSYVFNISPDTYAVVTGVILG